MTNIKSEANAVKVCVAACGPASPSTLLPIIAPSAPTSAPTTAAVIPTSAPAAPTAEAPGDTDQIVGTVVRFSTAPISVDVTIGEDNPTVRDFLSLLPLSMTLEEFAGSPGSDPVDGDLIYYTPWGNIGFYYDASGIGYSDQTIHIGTYNATPEQLTQLEGQPVTVAIAR